MQANEYSGGQQNIVIITAAYQLLLQRKNAAYVHIQQTEPHYHFLDCLHLFLLNLSPISL